MPLGIDATTRYSTNNWTKPIKQSELEKDEPYNTRLNRGLPPTPIGNPGLASIKAAAKPSTKKYLYYVRKANDDSGEHAFSTTYSEFEKDVARYNASREDGSDAAGRVRLAGRPLTVAADAQRRARPPRADDLALPEAPAPAAPVRGDRPRRCRTPASAAST